MIHHTLLIPFLIISTFCTAQLPEEKPLAPDLTVSISDGIVSLSISDNNPMSNNYLQGYSVYDEVIDDVWLFEGYKIYQVQQGLPGGSFDNPNYSRLIAQVDIVNEVDELINYVYDEVLDLCIPVLKVSGSNQGLEFEFEFSYDLWYWWDEELGEVSNDIQAGATYCYAAIAYVTNPNGDNGICEMPTTYIASESAVSGESLIKCISAPVGISELKADKVKLWSIDGTLILESSSIGKGELLIYSIDGQVIEQLSLDQMSRQSWDLSRFTSGIYIAEFRISERQITKRFFVE